MFFFLHVYHMCSDAYKSQNKVLDSLKLDLWLIQMIVDYDIKAGN